jgi:hypothetical protein
MRDDKKFWVKRLHPDDAGRVFSEMDGLIRAAAERQTRFPAARPDCKLFRTRC